MKSEKSRTLCGTPEYLPPELLHKHRRYEAEFVDPWALGVLALELLLGETPFQGENRSSIYAKILSFRGSLDRSLRAELDCMIATAAANGIIPPTSMTACALGGDLTYSYASMVEDFLQTIPTQRMSATECWERYADLLGPDSLVAPPRPSVKQRRQVFQNKSSDRALALFL